MRKGFSLETALTAVIVAVLATVVIPTQLKNVKKTESSINNVKVINFDTAYNYVYKHIKE